MTWQCVSRRQSRRSGRHTAASAARWGGRRLTFLFLNAKQLISKSFGAIKAIGLRQLLQGSSWPDLVGVTELGGAAGTTDVRDYLGADIGRRYTMVWSQRSVSLSGGSPDLNYKSGGGILLLVHKRLWLRVSELKMDVTDEEQAMLDGHLRVWRLDPIPRSPGTCMRRPHAMQRPIVVTVAYIPPVGIGWGMKVRSLIFDTIEATDLAIRQLRHFQDVFPLTMAHTNAPDGGCPIEMALESDVRPYGEVLQQLSRLPQTITRRATLVLTADGRRILQPCRSAAQARDVTSVGKQFVAAAARAGNIPLSGIMGHRQSTSWTHLLHQCVECSAGRRQQCVLRQQAIAHNADAVAVSGGRVKVHGCDEMSTSVHDIIMVPDYLVWQALTSINGGRHLLRQCTRRVQWAEAPLDHAVTSGYCFVGPMQTGDAGSAASAAPEAGNHAKAPRRYHPSSDLLLKHIELRRVCEQMDSNIYCMLDALDPVSGNDVDEMNSIFTKAALDACESARKRSADEECDAESMTVRRARSERHRYLVELHQTLSSRPAQHRDRTIEQKQRVRVANRLYQQSHRTLQELLRKQDAAHLLVNHKRKPAQFWSKMKLLASDPGAAHAEASAAFLLDHQNDENQKFVTSDPVQLKQNMRSNRQNMYAMKSEAKLGPSCTAAINKALVALHWENKATIAQNPTMVGLNSAAACSAADATSPMADADARRGVQRDLHEEMEEFDRSRGDMSSGSSVMSLHPEAVQQLHREVTMEELLSVCSKIRDVGPGTDGVAPIVLKLQQEGHTMVMVLQLFRRVQQTGTIPVAWRMHRNLFHYKGKNTDPYYLGNYRGLGIDQVLLKVWSLLLMERLEHFLAVTGGLSGLQGGFQRQRGPIEQAFTLTETVRAAIRRKTVYLLFLDIEQAYDSVIRPILWKCCMEKGIGGVFLAALQAIYYRAEARVDAGGILLDPVPLEVGVLQGNPLSPALFNIYIDSVIQQLMVRGAAHLSPFGVPLPLFQPGMPPVPSALDHDQAHHVPCLYFADDGCLLCFDPGILQLMLTITVDGLTALGLTVNVRKTKWMVVPVQWATVADYENKWKPSAMKNTPYVGSQPVALVDEFDYLGVTVWWRWDFTKAWRTAQNRARRCYFGALRGGWQHRAGSLNSQMSFAHAKLFCHFNYIAALTGAGGGKTTAPWLKNEDIVTWVLRAVSGQRFANADALRVEAGVWPWQCRCDMLLLRLWCKYVSMPPYSVFYRAMCLSLQSLTQEQRDHPSGTNWMNRVAQQHRQSWAQQLLAAAGRMGIPAQQVDQRQHGLLVVQVDALCNDIWAAPTMAEAAGVPVRLVSAVALADGVTVFEPGVTCWLMPPGTDAATVLSTWSPQHKEACYTELRRLGNQYRQRHVRLFLSDQIYQNTRLRMWATTLSGSFEQPYWRLADINLARRLLTLRFDMCPTEDYVRCRPSKGLPALGTPNGRACYLCDCIDGVPGIYWPETLVHVLLRCTCPELVALRATLRHDLEALSVELETDHVATQAGVARPSFQLDTALLTAMQLCIGVGPGSILVPNPIAPLCHVGRAVTRAVALQRATSRRDAPQFARDIPIAKATADWIRALTDDWCDILRNVRRRDNPLTSPGCRLANMVARHAVAVFSTRRKLLRASAGYAARVRDPSAPPPLLPRGVVHSPATIMHLNLWSMSITDESTGRANYGHSVNLSSPAL